MVIVRYPLIRTLCGSFGGDEEVEVTVGFGNVGAHGEGGFEEEFGTRRGREFDVVEGDADVAGGGKDVNALCERVKAL